MALMSTLKDGFNGAVLNTALWTLTEDAQAPHSFSGGRLVVTPTSSDAGINYTDVASGSYDMTGCGAAVEVVQAIGNAVAGAETYFDIRIDASNRVFWDLDANTLKAFKRVAGSSTEKFSAAYDPSAHRWWRIRESGGTTYWDTSADGISWTNRASEVNPIVVTSLVAIIGSGTYASLVLNPATTIFDNFNLPPNALVADRLRIRYRNLGVRLRRVSVGIP